MIDIFNKLLTRLDKESELLSVMSENDGSNEKFETPEMEEVLTENQTADEL